VAENDLAYAIPVHTWGNFPDQLDQSFITLSQSTVKLFKCCCNVHIYCLCYSYTVIMLELYVKMFQVTVTIKVTDL